MKSNAILSVLILLGGLCIAGCMGSTPGRTDPSSDAAELEGRWCLEGDERGFVGFFELDEDGDPVTLEDNPQVLDALAEDTLILNGVPVTTANGFEYTAIASASLDGTQAELFVDVRIYAVFGEVGAGLALMFEGERTATDTLEGVSVIVQDSVELETPELLIERGTAKKNSCD